MGTDEETPLHPGLQDILDRLSDAWDAADAAAFAGLFADDATYVLWRGDVLLGRSEIERAHHDLFTRWPSKTRVRTIHSRLLDDHTAVLLTVGGVGNEADVSFDKIQTFVMSRSEMGWMITAFHNSVMSDSGKQHYAR